LRRAHGATAHWPEYTVFPKKGDFVYGEERRREKKEKKGEDGGVSLLVDKHYVCRVFAGRVAGGRRERAKKQNRRGRGGNRRKVFVFPFPCCRNVDRGKIKKERWGEKTGGREKKRRKKKGKKKRKTTAGAFTALRNDKHLMGKGEGGKKFPHSLCFQPTHRFRLRFVGAKGKRY